MKTKTTQDLLQILGDLPGWSALFYHTSRMVTQANNLANGMRVRLSGTEPKSHLEVTYSNSMMVTLEPEDAETFVALQEAQALATFPQYWVATFFWKPHVAENHTRYEGGYDTVYLDVHPAQKLEEYRGKGYTPANLVCFSPITKAQYETEQARIG